MYFFWCVSIFSCILSVPHNLPSPCPFFTYLLFLIHVVFSCFLSPFYLRYFSLILNCFVFYLFFISFFLSLHSLPYFFLSDLFFPSPCFPLLWFSFLTLVYVVLVSVPMSPSFATNLSLLLILFIYYLLLFFYYCIFQ